MIIESLELRNFRNYENCSLSFDGGTNILYGDNAQGKTNILEAIHVAGTTRSHKGAHDAEMIRFQQEEAHIRMQIEKQGLHHQIDMHLKKNRAKGVAIDSLPIRKASELIGMVQLVLFSPEDLNIIKNGPRERRRFMDSELCQLNRIYYSELAKYNRVIAQRNRLLKDMPFSPDSSQETMLDVWDEQMAGCGAELIRMRQAFLDRIEKTVREIHGQLTEGKEDIELIYEPSVTADDFPDALRRQREKDKKWKSSTIGPHRDDFQVRLNGLDIRSYGSQGQQRSAALSLKLSEIHLIREITKDEPVLLLDDVLSELDSARQKMVLQNMNRVQTIITCTGMDDLIAHRFSMNKTFHIVHGTAE